MQQPPPMSQIRAITARIALTRPPHSVQMIWQGAYTCKAQGFIGNGTGGPI